MPSLGQTLQSGEANSCARQANWVQRIVVSRAAKARELGEVEIEFVE